MQYRKSFFAHTKIPGNHSEHFSFLFFFCCGVLKNKAGSLFGGSMCGDRSLVDSKKFLVTEMCEKCFTVDS